MVASASIARPKTSIEDLAAIGLSVIHKRHTRRLHHWKIAHGEDTVCSLSVYRHSPVDPWIIGYIETSEQWRRMGLAHLLYVMAVDRLGEVSHDANRTSDGNNWANAVGGHLPARNTDDEDVLSLSAYFSWANGNFSA